MADAFWSSIFLLTVSRMIALIPLAHLFGREGFRLPELQGQVDGLRDVLQHDGGLERVARRRSESKRAVMGKEHGGGISHVHPERLARMGGHLVRVTRARNFFARLLRE